VREEEDETIIRNLPSILASGGARQVSDKERWLALPARSCQKVVSSPEKKGIPS
jgi:hypothetical protein